MVAKPAPSFRAPTQPLSLGGLVEASLQLWLASWRATFFYALAYGLAGLLPALTLGDLATRMLRETLAVLLHDVAPWLPLAPASDPFALLDAAWAWLRAPSTWLLLGASTLLMFASLSLILHRQGAIAAGRDRGFVATTRSGLARVPAGVGAWLLYLGALLLAMLPVVALSALLFAFADRVGLGGLLGLLLLFLALGLLGSVPMAWLSVAAAFAPVAAASDGAGPWSAQWRSVRAVRGRWLHAALGSTVPLLIYLGIGSLVSSLLLMLCVALAWSAAGWTGLLDGRWLVWSQWLALAPMAAVLPIATAGAVTVWNDLQLRFQVIDGSREHRADMNRD